MKLAGAQIKLYGNWIKLIRKTCSTSHEVHYLVFARITLQSTLPFYAIFTDYLHEQLVSIPDNKLLKSALSAHFSV